MIGATLFSGIGAPEVAMPHWRWPWHAEIAKFPSAVMAARHQQSINLGNVAANDFTQRAAKIARPDVLVFGSPCQSYSVAGKRLGMDDPRGNLALVALGIVDRLKPRWFCFENVPGLFSSFSGSEHKEREVREGDVGGQADGEESRDLATFFARVSELGYSGAWASMDAQHFGVAQRRQRLFFVGHIGDWRHPAAVLLEPESLCGHHPPRREAGERTSPTLNARTSAGGGLGTDHDINGGLITREISHALNAGGMGRQDYETETLIAHSVAPPLNAGMGQRRGSGAHADPMVAIPILEAGAHTGKSTDDIRAGIGIGEPGDPMFTLQSGKQHAVGFNITPSNSNKDFNAREAEYAQALTAGGNRPSARGGDLIAFSSKDHGADAGEIAPTLRAMGHSGSHPNAGGQVAVAFDLRGREQGAQFEGPHDTANIRAASGGSSRSYVAASAVRRLTPRECERLQGFPDDFTLITYRGKPAADGPRYKALGNSMAVPVMRWILSRIEFVDALPKTAAA